MKKNLLKLSMLVLPFIGSSQITINQSDLPTIGDMWFELKDTTTHQTITPGGPNQTWDYSNFTVVESKISQVQNISAAPSAWNSNFPSAQTVDYNINDSLASYFSSNSTGFYVEGFYDGTLNAGSNNVTKYDPNYLVIPTPFTYNNTRNHTAKIILVFNQGFDYKIVIYMHQEFTADAYGSITTPAGTFNNTLRIKQLVYSEDSIYADFGSGYQPLSNTPAADTAISYSWAKNAPNTMVFTMDEKMNGPVGSGIASSATYFSATATSIPTFLKPTGSLAYPNPSNGSKFVTIHMDNKNSESLYVYNALGELIKTEKINGSEAILFDTNVFSDGIYIYKIMGKDSREITSGKFTITK
jgi:hypothetical protein